MVLWRISNHLSLTGDGALRTSGRWHTRGRRIVYLASTPAAALLEILVHAELNIRDLPTRYRLLKIDVPEDVMRERVSIDALGADWIDDVDATRAAGDGWLARRQSALLAVPSAVVSDTDNILFNPAHPDAPRVVIVRATDHVVDPRLLR